MYHRFLITAASLLFAACLSAQDNNVVADTVKVINNSKQILIQRSTDGNSTITILGDKDNPEYFYQLQVSKTDSIDVDDFILNANFPFTHNQNRKEVIEYDVARNIYFGIAAPCEGNKAISTSIELGIMQLGGITYTPTCQGFSISTGLGFGYRQYSLKSDFFLESGSDRILSVIPADSEISDCSSRIGSFYLQIPVLLTQKIYHKFAISGGAILNFNTYTTATTKFKSDNTYFEHTFKGSHQKPITIDLYATVGFKDAVGAFVRYTTSKMFDNGFGPDVKSITAGITLNF